MNTIVHDLSSKLLYVAILAGLVLAFTNPVHVAALPHASQVAASASAR
jgi:hypothetical protein